MDIFKANSTNAIAATATSQARAFATGGRGDNAVFYNDGPGLAFVATGTSAVVATLPALSAAVGAQGNATPVPVGTSVNLRLSAQDSYWAIICQAGGTAAVYCTSGEGL